MGYAAQITMVIAGFAGAAFLLWFSGSFGPDKATARIVFWAGIILAAASLAQIIMFGVNSRREERERREGETQLRIAGLEAEVGRLRPEATKAAPAAPQNLAITYCPACGGANSGGTKNCKHCTARLPS